MNCIAAEAPDANMLMFVDEAAKDECTSYSIVPIITLDGIITYDIIEGPVDGAHFVQFLKDHIMPFMNLYPGPRSVLVMDNLLRY
ncbi:hypothetical protein PAXRUDRAFT_20442 [Paxillus rubicundulus Ve08.2h10]|uniref:Unplaced genomic scaffold scaffold_4552, whole genome shotgun sequence n=1 Tax=Paxillus rubicundulus Ve08.2h10 TaxID=930991 RepID=A0A0D0D9K2_9AGAM|nr:hypothetical protein PAXRUDRAFT_20442 [Paxillus rubicundulus Ve08.2h10]